MLKIEKNDNPGKEWGTSPPKKEVPFLNLQVAKTTQVTIEKMASNSFEGWKIKFNDIRSGYIKFIPKVDKIFKSHVTVDIHISKPRRGLHIARIALKKAINASQYILFVAHLRKSNIASKKVLAVVDFKIVPSYPGKQLCMVYEKTLGAN